ncbi:hypothetical protein [Veillonella agrestimuris]|uniref:hypothetical protein n=1 Tax=Veillonella agrestimuris TaxID=2941340 RepID=UPI00203A64E3|nr:hypothetical protein [Veillonella agrestimuris]
MVNYIIFLDKKEVEEHVLLLKLFYEENHTNYDASLKVKGKLLEDVNIKKEKPQEKSLYEIIKPYEEE